jgi:hypothetical protein
VRALRLIWCVQLDLRCSWLSAPLPFSRLLPGVLGLSIELGTVRVARLQRASHIHAAAQAAADQADSAQTDSAEAAWRTQTPLTGHTRDAGFLPACPGPRDA